MFNLCELQREHSKEEELTEVPENEQSFRDPGISRYIPAANKNSSHNGKNNQ